MNTPLEEAPTCWSSSFEFNDSSLDFDHMPMANQDEFGESPFGFELATPNHDPATSPYVHVPPSEMSGHLSEAELEQYIKDLTQGACMTSPDFPVASLSQQQSLMVSTMNYSDDYLTTAFPSLDAYAPAAEEEFAMMPTTLMNSSMLMSGPIYEQQVFVSGPGLNMDESMSVVGINSASTMAPYGQVPYAPQMLAAPAAPVPLLMPLPGLPMAPSTHFPPAPLSPHTSEGHMGRDGMLTDRGSSDTGRSHRCLVPECHGSFSTRAQLKKHMDRHNRVHKCPVCGKGHGAKKDNDRHMWTHHAEEAQRLGIKSPKRLCPVDGCTNTEQRDDNMKRHIRTHHPEYLDKAGKAAKK